MTKTPAAPADAVAKPKRGRPRKAEAKSLVAFMSDVRDAAEFAESFRTGLLDEYPGGIDSDFIFHTAQAVFEADVARKGDLKNHIALRRLRQTDRAQDDSHRQRERAIEQRERQLELAREKFEFDAAAAVLDHLTEVRAIAADRSLRHPAKIQAVRRRLFGEPPPPDESAREAAESFARPAAVAMPPAPLPPDPEAFVAHGFHSDFQPHPRSTSVCRPGAPPAA